MQVCLNGHVITDAVDGQPESTKNFCPLDGEQTSIRCGECKEFIPGCTHFSETGRTYEFTPPDHCEHCGSPFPWTVRQRDAREAAAKTAREQADADKQRSANDAIERLFDRFDIVVKQLRKRRENRHTLDVEDEYDVQDLLHAMLRLYFDDIRTEEWTPSYAGKASRMDFLLRSEEVVIETKMARPTLTHKEVGDELLVDIARYKGHPHCKELWCFVYDPRGYVSNPRGIETDLSGERDGLSIEVRIRA